MTTQNNNEFLEGDSNSRENFENKWNWPEDKWKPEKRSFYESFDSRFALRYGENGPFKKFDENKLEIECKKD